ncbi:MAG: DEAD/DEAH box helicase [Polyangia bacterium]
MSDNLENSKASDANESTAESAASFEDFELLPEVAEAIGKLGFESPTPVQARTYREIMSGQDVIVMAQTGTGKTAAFGIPLAQRLDPNAARVQALVLTPTRELALQVSRELDAIGEQRELSCVAIYGGASFSKQVEQVRAGCAVIAGTPGRVLDHLRRGTISFDGLRVLVLDEADEMLSMGFEKELSEIMERLPERRQNLLFSATIPDDIQRLAGRYMDEALRISVSGDAVAATEISHYVYLVSGMDRPGDLVRVIEAERPDSAIIFCNTRDETQAVARHLSNSGYDADWINSDLSQAERERVMTATRSGELRFMVATDVAARGIDISHLSHVINYSFPESLEAYVHRTGRTGRQGRHGAAVSLVTPQDIGNLYFLRLTYKIFPVERTLPSEKLAERDQELTRLETLRRALSGSPGGQFSGLARRVLQDVSADRIVAGLLEAHFEGLEKIARSRGERGGGRKKDDERKTSSRSRRKRRAQSEGSAETPRKDRGTSGGRPEKKERSERPRSDETKSNADDRDRGEARESDATDAKGTQERAREIYLDAGRKDGLRISALMKEIVERSGLPRSAVGRVRMLTRSTFISVPEENFEAVLEAAGKIELDGRRLGAEPAEES